MKHLLLAFIAIILIASCSSKKELETINSPTAETRTQTDRGERGDRQGRRGAPPSIDEVFKMDTNGDGLLAKSEVQGRLLERFATIDANEDGFISKEEFANAPRPQRRGGNRN